MRARSLARSLVALTARRPPGRGASLASPPSRPSPWFSPQWGKAVHEWSASPAEALARLIHLNNRYALDGHAPPSYGGILWCFGGFDSAAKGGETHAVTGAIKARPIERHARRLDPAALLRAARERNGTVGGRGGGAGGGVVGMLRRAADLNARSAAALPAPASG